MLPAPQVGNRGGPGVVAGVMSGFQPTNPRTHRDRGPCALCGEVTKLTKTHIPPKKAFNDGVGRRMVVGLDGSYVLESKGRAGGLAPYGHCEQCRAATSPWDDEYLSWAKSFTVAMVSSEEVGTRPLLKVGAAEARPGRFARAALAGMVVLAEGLWRTNPEFVESIRTGSPITDDAGMRLLMGVTPRVERAELSGAHGRVMVTVPLDESPPAEPLKTLSAMVQWPPFSLVLVDSDVAPSYPHVDVTSWLAWRVDEMVAPFAVELPCLRLASAIVATARDYEPALI